MARGRDHDPVAKLVATGFASSWLLFGCEFRLQTAGQYVVVSEGPGALVDDRVGNGKAGLRLGR